MQWCNGFRCILQESFGNLRPPWRKGHILFPWSGASPSSFHGSSLTCTSSIAAAEPESEPVPFPGLPHSISSPFCPRLTQYHPLQASSQSWTTLSILVASGICLWVDPLLTACRDSQARCTGAVVFASAIKLSTPAVLPA